MTIIEYSYFCEQQSNGAAAAKNKNVKAFVKASKFTGKNAQKSKRKVRTMNILTAKRGTPSSFKEFSSRASATTAKANAVRKAAATRAAKKAAKQSKRPAAPQPARMAPIPAGI